MVTGKEEPLMRGDLTEGKISCTMLANKAGDGCDLQFPRNRGDVSYEE